MKTFNVINQMIIEDSSVLTLSNRRTTDEYNTSSFICDDSLYPYIPTHNPNLISVKSTKDFIGKRIQFIA